MGDSLLACYSRGAQQACHILEREQNRGRTSQRKKTGFRLAPDLCVSDNSLTD